MDSVQDLNKVEGAKNRYRFRRLEERIADTDVGISRQILADHELELMEIDETSELADTFLKQELSLVHETDRTEGFRKIFKTLIPLVQSLPLVLHNLELIVTLLLDGLTGKVSFSALSFLKLFVALAKDSQGDFFPFLGRICENIFSIIVLNDAALCSQIFKTVGGMFSEMENIISKRDPELLFFRKQLIFLVTHRRDYIRRFTGEMLAPIIRKLPVKNRNKFIKLLVCGLAGNSDCSSRSATQTDEIVDGVARILFNVLRNVQNRLHSSSSEILSFLLKIVARSSNQDSAVTHVRFKCVERTLFHTLEFARAESSSDVWTALVSEISSHSHPKSILAYLCELLGTCYGHRWGTRVGHDTTEIVLVKVLSVCTKLVHEEPRHVELVKKSLFLLVKMLIVEEKGKKLHSTKITKLIADILIVCNALQVEYYLTELYPLLDDSLFDETVLPLFHSYIQVEVLTDHHVAVLAHIANLVFAESSSLSLPRISWGCALTNKCSTSLKTSMFALDCFQLFENGNSFYESTLVKFVGLTENATAKNRALIILSRFADWNCSPANRKLKQDLVKAMTQQVGSIINEGRSLGAFVDLISDCEIDPLIRKSLSKHLLEIVDNLLDASHLLRAGTLRLLSLLETPTASEDPTLLSNVSVLKMMLDLENMPVSFENERLRQQAISNLESSVRQKHVDPSILRIISRFYIGQLHVKYAPAWKMISAAIVSFSNQYFESHLWEPLWLHTRAVSVLSWDAGLVATEEEEHEFTDQSSTTTVALFEATFNCLKTMAKKVEFHSSDLMSLFFKFLKDEYYCDRNVIETPMLNADEYKYLEVHGECLTDLVLPKTNRKTSTTKLRCWLQVISHFTKFRDPKVKHCLRNIATRFTISTEAPLQKLSLEVLFAMNIPFLRNHKDSFLAMADEEKYREEMTRIDLTKIEDEHRSDYLQVLTRLLYAKLSTRIRRTSKDKYNAASRRATILAFFSGFSSEELVHFLHLVFRAFPQVDPASKIANLQEELELYDVENVETSRIVGFLQMMEDVIKQLGYNVEPYLDRIVCSFIAILYNSENATKQENNGKVAEIRGLIIRRFSEFFNVYRQFDMSKWSTSFASIMNPLLFGLPSSVVGSCNPPAMLNLILSLSETDDTCVWVMSSACPSMLPQLIRCLASGVSEGKGGGTLVIRCIMDTITNLLMSTGDKQRVIVPHVPLMPDTLLLRLEHGAGKTLSKQELTILKYIAETQSGALAMNKKHSQGICLKLVDLMLPYLQFTGAHISRSYKFVSSSSDSRRSEFVTKADARGELLRIIAGLVKVLGYSSKYTNKYLVSFSKLFGVLENDAIYDGEARKQLLEVFMSLFPDKWVAPLMVDLNAWDRRRVGEFDFDKRLEAYEKLSDRILNLKVDHDQLLAPCHQAIMDMEEDDYPLRSASLNFLCKSILSDEQFLDTLILPVILPGIVRGMTSSASLVRKGFVHLLADTVHFAAKLKSPVKAALFADLIQVADDADFEKDFFTSIVHVQTHRQSKCLIELRTRVAQGDIVFSVETITKVLIPLALEIMMSSSKEKDMHMKEEGALFIGQISQLLPWAEYSSLLKNLLGKALLLPDLEVRLLRAACKVVDHFHFEEQMIENPKILFVLNKQLIPKLERHMKHTKSTDKKTSIQKVRIHVAISIVKLLKRLPDSYIDSQLPRILGDIVDCLKSLDLGARSGARETLVAVALEMGASKLPVIIESMRSRLVEGYQLHVYGFSMYVLLKGVENMLIEDLRAHRLANKQYMPRKWFKTDDGQVVEEESSDISETLNIQVCDGMGDKIVSHFAAIVEEELFGDLGKQKAKDSEYHSRIHRLTESQTTKSFEILEILSRVIAFLPSQSIHLLLKPLLLKVDTSSDLRELRVAEEGIRRVGIGLSQNEDVRVPHLLVYVHHLVSEEYRLELEESMDVQRSESVTSNWLISESKTEAMKAQRKVIARNAYEGIHIVEAAPQLTGKDRFDKKRSKTNALQATKKANKHIITGHALLLLLRFFKVKRLRSNNEDHRAMLDPFVDLLLPVCRVAKASKTLVLGLRTLTLLLEWKLPRLEDNMDQISKCLFKTLQSVGFTIGQGGATGSAVSTSLGTAVADSAQECMRSLTTLLSSCTYFKVSDEQLKLMVLVVQHNVTLEHRQGNSLALLRAIVQRKIVVPEIYDLMNTLTKEVYTARASNAREMSAQIMVQFFIQYPLTPKRLRQHLDIIVGNLDYIQEDGRKTGLQMLVRIVDRFPQELVDDIAQYLFFSLVMRLVNEDSLNCRAMVVKTLKALLTRVELDTLHGLLEIVAAWLPNADLSNKSEMEIPLLTAGIQMVGIISQCGKQLKLKQLEPLASRCLSILETFNCENSEDWKYFLVGNNSDSTRFSFGWYVCYHCIVSLHQMALNCGALGSLVKYFATPRSNGRKSILEQHVFPIARYFPHPWVRLACMQLIGEMLSAMDIDDINSSSKLFLHQPQHIFQLSQILSDALSRDGLDDAIADQIVKNLVFVSRYLVTVEPENSLELVNVDNDVSDDDKTHSNLNWLLHRLSFIARYKGGQKDNLDFADLRQVSVFKVFAFVATQFKPGQIEKYLMMIMSPLVRVVALNKAEDTTVTKTSSKLKSPGLALEVLQLVEQMAIPERYLQTYSNIQSRIHEVRTDRKRKIAIEAITDPANASVKKKSRNLSKRDGKKRKIQKERQFFGK